MPHLDPAQWFGIAVLAFSTVMFVLSQIVPDADQDETQTEKETEQ